LRPPSVCLHNSSSHPHLRAWPFPGAHRACRDGSAVRLWIACGNLIQCPREFGTVYARRGSGSAHRAAGPSRHGLIASNHVRTIRQPR
jgi:hypothetical protein